MKPTIAISVILVAAGLLLPTGAMADEVQDAMTKLLQERTGCLVVVEFDLKRIDGRGGREVKLQGTLVGKEGLVLVTQAKQVDPPVGGDNAKPEKIKVRFPGDVKRDAHLVGKDERLNLALLRIDPVEGEVSDFPVAGFDRTATLQAGQPLLALKRLGLTDDDLVTFQILRVATIIPRPGLPTEYRLLGNLRGFEGCAVFALDSRLVGYISASTQTRRSQSIRFVNGRMVRTSTGDGDAGHPTRLLHSEVIREFLSDPTKFARRDCWLGVKGLQALTKPLAEAYGFEKPGGLVVGEVSENSPAERAGLLPGDVVVTLDGAVIETDKDRDVAAFRNKIRRGKAGEKHELVVVRRSGDELIEVHLAVTLEEAPVTENEIPEYNDKVFGLKLKPLTRDFLERSRLPLDTKGVRVTSVERAGWANLAGVRAGDVIQKLVLRPCDDLAQYKQIMSDLMESRDSEVCYNVTRSRKSLFLCVRPDWDSVEKPGK